MAKNQTFSVSLSLLTKNFQKGVKTVQTSLNNLKMQFRNFAAAFGAGLGITEVLRNMVDSAKQLDKAQTVLKNVSNGVGNYAQNQKFVMDLSKKYNQELTVLMGNYAKFHSAANMANMSMEEQTHIYEALTRAGTYYSLTADEMNGVMLAVNQMISKGKVSSEELRRQLGERLPGAMNYAAKAMGVTTKELDEMIRDGKVMAEELLPLLVEELNRVTKNLDVNTVQGGLARMKNAFTELTKKVNVGDIYKKIINGVADGLEYISNNLTKVKNQILATFLGIFGGGFINKVRANFNAYVAEVQASLGRANTLLMTHKSQLMGLANKGLISIDFDENNFIKEIKKLQAFDGNGLDISLSDKEFEKAQQHVANYNKYLRQSVELSQQNTSAMGWFQKSINNLGKAFGTLMKQFAPMLIIYAVTRIIQKFKEWRDEVRRIKNLVKDTMAELDAAINTPTAQEIELQELKLAAFDTKSYDAARKDVIDSINKILGTEFTVESTNFEINNAINERLKLLKEERTYQENLAKIVEQRKLKEDKLNEIQKKRDRITEIDKKLKTFANAGSGYATIRASYKKEKLDLEGEIEDITVEIGKLDEIIQTITDRNSQYVRNAAARQAAINNENGNAEPTPDQQLIEDYNKIQEEYNNALRALNDKKKDGLITEEEYNDALEDLYKSTLDSIYALNDINENANPFAKSLKEAYLAVLANKKKEDEVQNALDKYHEGVQKLYNQYNNGVITHEELEEELYNLLDEVVRTVASMGDLSGATELLAAELKRKKTEIANKAASKIENPTSGNRDATFDYSKSDSDILGEVADIYREYEEKLKSTIEQLEDLEPTDEIVQRLEELNAELERTTANAETMEDAFKFAKISEDVKSLTKELNEGVWDNFKNIADAADRLTSAVKDVVETFEDVDASEWEKILSIFNAITQITDTILQTVQMFTQLIEVMDKLKQAETAYQAVQAAGTAQTVAGAATTVAAKQAEATASGTASAAKMPFPYNLLAIMGVVGMIASIFASLPKFAHGGIVQGSSTIGDRNLARVNAGEMILNKQQQATLFGMLNGSNSGAMGKSSKVEFKIRGSELVGVLNNYGKKIKG